MEEKEEGEVDARWLVVQVADKVWTEWLASVLVAVVVAWLVEVQVAGRVWMG